MNGILRKKIIAANISKGDVAKAVPSLKIEKLFNGFREVRLFHGSEEYRLSLTKNNKLILTK